MIITDKPPSNERAVPLFGPTGAFPVINRHIDILDLGHRRWHIYRLGDDIQSRDKPGDYFTA